MQRTIEFTAKVRGSQASIRTWMPAGLMRIEIESETLAGGFVRAWPNADTEREG